MAIKWHLWSRKFHRWGAVVVALPFLLVILTGLLLLLKKDWAWVQPPTQRGQGKTPTVALSAILDAARTQTSCGVEGWDDIDRLDLRPGRGIVKVQCKNGWEIQIDLQTAEVLQVAYRRSDLLEALHDGSWFHDRVRLWIFFPVALVVLGLWATGIYLFILPIHVRWSRRRAAAARTAPR